MTTKELSFPNNTSIALTALLAIFTLMMTLILGVEYTLDGAQVPNWVNVFTIVSVSIATILVVWFFVGGMLSSSVPSDCIGFWKRPSRNSAEDWRYSESGMYFTFGRYSLEGFVRKTQIMTGTYFLQVPDKERSPKLLAMKEYTFAVGWDNEAVEKFANKFGCKILTSGFCDFEDLPNNPFNVQQLLHEVLANKVTFKTDDGSTELPNISLSVVEGTDEAVAKKFKESLMSIGIFSDGSTVEVKSKPFTIELMA